MVAMVLWGKIRKGKVEYNKMMPFFRMKDVNTCLTDSRSEVLEDHFAGKTTLSNEALECIFLHVSECNSCQQKLQTCDFVKRARIQANETESVSLTAFAEEQNQFHVSIPPEKDIPTLHIRLPEEILI